MRFGPKDVLSADARQKMLDDFIVLVKEIESEQGEFSDEQWDTLQEALEEIFGAEKNDTRENLEKLLLQRLWREGAADMVRHVANKRDEYRAHLQELKIERKPEGEEMSNVVPLFPKK